MGIFFQESYHVLRYGSLENPPLWGKIIVKFSHLLLTLSSAINILIYSYKVRKLSILRFQTYLHFYVSLLTETKNIRTLSLVKHQMCQNFWNLQKVNVDKVLTFNFKKALYFNLFFLGFQVPSGFENILRLDQLGQTQSWGRTFTDPLYYCLHVNWAPKANMHRRNSNVMNFIEIKA